MKWIYLVAMLAASQGVYGEVKFPKDYIELALQARGTTQERYYIQFGQQLLEQPAIESTRVPPPAVNSEYRLRTALQMELNSPTSESLEYLKASLREARIVNIEKIDRPVIESISAYEWQTRFDLYSFAYFEASFTLKAHIEYLAFRSLIEYIHALDPRDLVQKSKIVEMFFTSTLLFESEPLYFCLFLDAMDLNYYRQLDYKRHNRTIEAVKASAFIDKTLQNREQARQQVRQSQETEFMMLRQARSNAASGNCGSMF